MKILGNPDWTHPLVRTKNAATEPARRGLARLRRWVPKTPAESETEQRETIRLAGDKPGQRRLVYKISRPQSETHNNLLYTPQGMSVLGGKIIERLSVRTPSLREILTTPRRAAREIAQGTIIEAETPYTYGDWVGDFTCSLVTAEEIIEPLVLPPFLAEKPYVMRDIGALGLSYVTADAPVLIEKAHVLRKRIPSYYWGGQEVAAFRKAFKISPPPTTPGSIIYLGRFETVSESVQRKYPTQMTANIIEDIGGRVFDAREASPTKFNEIAKETQSVIADQGSALFGVMHWQTKNVIELTRRDWWHSANLFIAKGAGVENYAVIAVDGLDEDALRARIVEHLKAFRVLS